MADRQAQIPQQVQDRLDQADGPLVIRPLYDEGQVDIRMRGHFLAPVAARGDDRDGAGCLALGDGGKLARGVIVNQADDLIEQEALPATLCMPRRRMFHQTAREFGATFLERIAQQREHRIARFPPLARQFRDRLGELAPVDDGALVGEGRGAQVLVWIAAYLVRSALRSIFCVPSRGSESASCQMWAGRLNGGSLVSRNADSSSSLKLAPSLVW